VKVDQSKRLKGHTGDVYALELFCDDNVRRFGNMISGGDYSLRTWKSEVKQDLIKFGTVTQTFHGHTGYVSCLKVHGRRAFSGSWDTTVRSWNLDVLVSNTRLEKACMYSKDTKISSTALMSLTPTYSVAVGTQQLFSGVERLAQFNNRLVGRCIFIEVILTEFNAFNTIKIN
jgi:WD40 repeat protein